ncbi:ATP-dependent DNA ligase [Promicromonospora panici]|uniref:ATP-dependent DNA ligase n=1 Tax=Promicromonospora panici TaxID=2219658 RepID=UPI00101C5BA9|nr:ATP-dependent DNA ligase [Promicromonospora panici]
MLLAEVAATSDAVSATRSRLAKRAAIADLLRRTAAGDSAAADQASTNIEIVVAYIAGALRQRRTGLGYAALRDLPPPASEATLTVRAVDAAFAEMAALEGPGSAQARSAAAADLFGAATEREQAFLRGLVAGELRQGALDSVVVDAVAEAAGTPPDAVRRAVMMRGATGPVASAALLAEDPLGALATFTLEVGRPVRPMLAQSAPDIAAAFEKLSSADAPTELCVDVKLDGIRIQVHRLGDDIRVVTRSLDDITERVPEIVDVVRALPSDRLVLDGEALAIGEDGVPRPFQETAARSATREATPEAELASQLQLSPFFFDVLHADGRDLVDAPLHERLAVLDEVAAPHVVRRLVTSDPEAAAEFFAGALREGQEGVVVKSLDTPYAAGRRGAGWIKVKPRQTLDLVVLAVERGSGRRQGWLSNIHLGARDPEGGFVMLGKMFKGMTDEMLEWQTARFTELKTDDNGWVVTVRPEQVVEIAFDGLQRSTRYPGGLALRFARVLRYRDDKSAAEADTIETVRTLAGF